MIPLAHPDADLLADTTQEDRAAAIAAWRLILMLPAQVATGDRKMIAARLALAADLAVVGQYHEAESVLLAAWNAGEAIKDYRYERQRDILEKLGQLYAAWAEIDPARKRMVSTWEKTLTDFEAGHTQPRGQCA